MNSVEKVIEIVSSAPTSIFMKQDIINLLTDSTLAPDPDNKDIPHEAMMFTYKDVQAILEYVKEQIENTLNDLPVNEAVDYDSAEFSVNSNYIELDSIDWNISYVCKEIADNIDLDEAIDNL